MISRDIFRQAAEQHTKEKPQLGMDWLFSLYARKHVLGPITAKEQAGVEFGSPQAILKKVPFTGDLGLEERMVREAVERLQKGDYSKPQLDRTALESYGMYVGMMTGGRAFGTVDPTRFMRQFSEEEDRKIVEDYLLRQYEASVRGTTMGAKVVAGLSALPTWMTEFAMSGGAAKVLSEPAKLAMKKLLGKAAGTLAGRAAVGTAKIAAGAVARAGGPLVPKVITGAEKRQLDADLGIRPAESIAESYAKSFGDMAIEAFSEETGDAFGTLVSTVLNRTRLGKGLLSFVKKSVQALTGGAAGEPVRKAIRAAGYHGLPYESLEERVGTFLRSLFNIDSQQAGLLDRVKKDLADDLKKENLVPELLVLATPMTSAFGLGMSSYLYTAGREKIRFARELARYRKEMKSRLLTEDMFMYFAKSHPKEAEALSKLETPSRKDFERLVGVGIKLSASERKAFAEGLANALKRLQEEEDFINYLERIRYEDLQPELQESKKQEPAPAEETEPTVREQAEPKKPLFERPSIEGLGIIPRIRTLIEYGSRLADISKTYAGMREWENIGKELEWAETEITRLEGLLAKSVGVDPGYIAKKLGIEKPKDKDLRLRVYRVLGIDDYYKTGLTGTLEDVKAAAKRALHPYERQALKDGLIQRRLDRAKQKQETTPVYAPVDVGAGAGISPETREEAGPEEGGGGVPEGGQEIGQVPEKEEAIEEEAAEPEPPKGYPIVKIPAFYHTYHLSERFDWTKRKPKSLEYHDNKQWAITGGVRGKWLEAVEVVPERDYTGTVSEKKRGKKYEQGRVVFEWQGTRYISTGNKVIFQSDEKMRPPQTKSEKKLKQRIDRRYQRKLSRKIAAEEASRHEKWDAKKRGRLIRALKNELLNAPEYKAYEEAYSEYYDEVMRYFVPLHLRPSEYKEAAEYIDKRFWLNKYIAVVEPGSIKTGWDEQLMQYLEKTNGFGLINASSGIIEILEVIDEAVRLRKKKDGFNKKAYENAKKSSEEFYILDYILHKVLSSHDSVEDMNKKIREFLNYKGEESTEEFNKYYSIEALERRFLNEGRGTGTEAAEGVDRTAVEGQPHTERGESDVGTTERAGEERERHREGPAEQTGQGRVEESGRVRPKIQTVLEDEIPTEGLEEILEDLEEGSGQRELADEPETLPPKPDDDIPFSMAPRSAPLFREKKKPDFSILDEHQKLGVALALKALFNGKNFLLADGTGVGKTMELLTIAHGYKKRTGKPVVIITQSKSVAETRFKSDAEKLGIDLSEFVITTYHQLSKGNVPKGEFGLAVFDEAHNFKNPHSKKSIAGLLRLKASQKVYATATPFDRVWGAEYFLSEITGIPAEKIRERLGYSVINRINPDTGEMEPTAVLDKGYTWSKVHQNILELRNEAIRQGLMIRREYPFYGKLQVHYINPPISLLEDEENIWNYYDRLIRRTASISRRKNLGGMRANEMVRLVEHYKWRQLWSMAKKDIEEGRHVVIVGGRYNPSELKGLRTQTGPFIADPPLRKWEEKLQEMGVPYAKIFELPEQKRIEEISRFQKGDVKVVLMTALSGGTGIDLDDVLGSKPRTVYIDPSAVGYSGEKFEQLMGRFSRRNTKSPTDVHVVFFESPSDRRVRSLIMKKMSALRAIQKGVDADEAFGFTPPEEEKKRPGIVQETDVEEPIEPEDYLPESRRPKKKKYIPQKIDLQSPVRDKDLFGRPELIGGASGKQKMLFDPEDYLRVQDVEDQLKLFESRSAQVPHPPPLLSDNTANVKLVQLRELVQLAKMLRGTPQITRFFRRYEIEGMFYPKSGIKLRSSLAIGPAATPAITVPIASAQRAIESVLSHLEEEGIPRDKIHVIKWNRGNKVRIEFIKEDPEYAAKILAHEIGHLVDYLPDETLSRGNILGHVAVLKNFIGKTIAVAPEIQNLDLDEHDKKFLMEKARKNIRALYPERLAGNERERLVNQEYKRLVKEALQKRGIISRQELMTELFELSKWWRPFQEGQDPKYDEYRKRPTELYADALSVLLNNPQALAARAPRFYNMFFAYLPKKPEVESAYYAIQDAISSGTTDRDAVHRLRTSQREANRKIIKAINDSRMIRRQEWLKSIVQLFVDRFGEIKRISRLHKDILERYRINPEAKIEQAVYSQSTFEYYFDLIKMRVEKILIENGFTWEDFDEYLTHQRIINERSTVFNPQGWTVENSKQRLKEMKSIYGEQYDALEQARKEFWQIRKELIIYPIVESGMLSDSLNEKLLKNEFYATFYVAKYIQAKESGSGANISSGFYRQIGTFEDIAGPFSATLLKDISLITTLNWNKAKEETIRLLLHTGEAEKAETVYVEGRQIVKKPSDKTKTVLSFMKEGKVFSYYVDRYIGDAFNHKDPKALRVFAMILRGIGAPMRMIFTGINPGFWTFNIKRDFGRAFRNAEKASVMEFLRYWLRSVKPAFLSAWGIPTETVSEMLRANMLISVADYAGLTEEDVLAERLLTMYTGQSIRAKDPLRKFISLLQKYVWYPFLRISEAFERIPHIAQYLYYKEKFPNMSQDELAHRIRTQSGSPDFLAKGVLTPITNNLFLFSNPAIQGIRSDLEVMKERGADFWWKLTETVLLPKILMWTLRSGALVLLFKALGADDEDEAVQLAEKIRSVYSGVSEYDMTNYFVIPIGTTEQGKTVYLRIPQDETGRSIGGIAYKFLRGLEGDLNAPLQALHYGASQLPNLNPVITAAIATWEYLGGQNPYDAFRGEQVIPDTLFKAKTWDTHKYFARYLMRNLGLGLFSVVLPEDKTTIQTRLERYLGMPIVQRWIKVSDYGKSEKARESIQEAERERAREILELRKLSVKILNGETLTDEENEMLKRNNEYVQSYLKTEQSRRSDAWTRQIQAAPSISAKKKIIEKIKNTEGAFFPISDYAKPVILYYIRLMARPVPVKPAERKFFFEELNEGFEWFQNVGIPESEIRRISLQEADLSDDGRTRVLIQLSRYRKMILGESGKKL